MTPEPLTREPTTLQTGFTLVELLVVLTIIGLAAAALPAASLALLPHRRLQAEAGALLEALRNTRRAAVEQDVTARFSIDPHGSGWRSEATGKSRTMPSGVAIEAQGAVLPDSVVIAFYPDGSSTGGQLSVRRGDDCIPIAIDWLTGLATQPAP